MTERPRESEPDSLEFEAEGLPCVMQRNPHWRTWCGYVGIGKDHPLHGLPTNHLLKLPSSWFDGRSLKQGYGPFDLFLHVISAASITDACPISLAFEVHGGVNFADDQPPGRKPDGRWWFGFDCGHAGDYIPGNDSIKDAMNAMVDSMPEHVRALREIVNRSELVYRDQQYVVGECQSLAAQLIAVVKVIEGEKINDQPDRDRR